jgi:hypothetical protein
MATSVCGRARNASHECQSSCADVESPTMSTEALASPLASSESLRCTHEGRLLGPALGTVDGCRLTHWVGSTHTYRFSGGHSGDAITHSGARLPCHLPGAEPGKHLLSKGGSWRGADSMFNSGARAPERRQCRTSRQRCSGVSQRQRRPAACELPVRITVSFTPRANALKRLWYGTDCEQLEGYHPRNCFGAVLGSAAKIPGSSEGHATTRRPCSTCPIPHATACPARSRLCRTHRKGRFEKTHGFEKTSTQIVSQSAAPRTCYA